MEKKNKYAMVLIFILLSGMCFIAGWAMSLESTVLEQVRDVENGKSIVSTWACYDGCYNMLVVYFNNTTPPFPEYIKEDFYNPCSDMCFNQYFNLTRFK